MKTVTKVVLGGAMLAGSVATHAANMAVPLASTGSSDLMFIVNDVTAGTSYTVALTQVVGSGAGSYFNSAGANTAGPVAGTTLGTIADPSFSYNLSGNSGLQSFITTAQGASHTIQWAIMGGVYTGTTPPQRSTRGNTLIVTTGTDASVLPVTSTSLIGGVANGLNTDIGKLNAQTSDGATPPGTATGIFGTASASAGETSLSLYGTNVVQGNANFAGGNPITLYGITASGSGGALGYILGSLTFNGTSLIFTGAGGAVPIPAAGWLFGSGILGLLGIGRRRRSATETA